HLAARTISLKGMYMQYEGFTCPRLYAKTRRIRYPVVRVDDFEVEISRQQIRKSRKQVHFSLNIRPIRLMTLEVIAEFGERFYCTRFPRDGLMFRLLKDAADGMVRTEFQWYALKFVNKRTEIVCLTFTDKVLSQCPIDTNDADIFQC